MILCKDEWLIANPSHARDSADAHPSHSPILMEERVLPVAAAARALHFCNISCTSAKTHFSCMWEQTCVSPGERAAAACTHTCSRLSRNHLCDFQQQKTIQPPTSALKEQLTHRSIASIPVLCGHRLNLSGRLLSTHLALHNFLGKLFLSFQDSTLPVPQ